MRVGRWGRPWAGALVALVAVPAVADAQPRVTIPEPVHDFGTVERGAAIDHTFVLQNTGDTVLRIEQVKSSCGCTVAVASARDVPPGGAGRVTVTLDTTRLAGTTRKVATVYTSDPAAPAVGLTLAGQVSADLVVAPTPLYFGRVRRGQRVERELLITSGRPGAAYVVTAVESSNPAVRARLEPGPDGQGQRVIVSLDDELPPGQLSDQLTLRTSSPREPVLTVPVLARIEGDAAAALGGARVVRATR